MSKWVRKASRKKGFTLIELIAVIAILGILALIAVPRLGAFRQKADDAKLESNIRIAKGAAALCLAAEGTPEDGDVEWDEEGTSDLDYDWRDYLDEWPNGVTSLTIHEDTGDISTVPASANP